MPAEHHYNARSILGLNFLLWFWCFLAFLLCPHLLIGLSGRGGGCLATILAVSVLSNRASVFLLSGSFQRAWHFVGKHFPGQVLQDLLGCGAFGNRGPACQELRSLRPPPPPRAAEQAGPAALVLTWLFNLPAECSFSPVKQSGVSGCCPSLPCPQNVWPFIPASESSLSRPEMLIYSCNNRIWTRLSLTAHGCLCLLMVAPVKSRLLLHLIFRFQYPIFLLPNRPRRIIGVYH